MMTNQERTNPFCDASLLKRRAFLRQLGDGFGACALMALLQSDSLLSAASTTDAEVQHPRKPHHPAKARSVIQIFCPGGLSHVDTWDYRPELERLHGKPFDAELGKQTFAGTAGEYAKSFWEFRQHGQCGRWISS